MFWFFFDVNYVANRRPFNCSSNLGGNDSLKSCQNRSSMRRTVPFSRSAISSRKCVAASPRKGLWCSIGEGVYQVGVIPELARGQEFYLGFRPAAGCDHGNPDLLRTPEALLKSVDYLIEVYEREDLPFGMRFSFVEDRMRAVRFVLFTF